MGKCGTSASVNHSRRKAMKKIILSLLAAGLSGTALLHAAEPSNWTSRTWNGGRQL